MQSSLQLMLPVEVVFHVQLHGQTDESRRMQPTADTQTHTAGRSTSAFLTYIRDSVRNTVACMFGSKTLCLFRHFYLLERRKILRRFRTSTVSSHTLWGRLFRRDASPFKHHTALQHGQQCSLLTPGQHISVWVVAKLMHDTQERQRSALRWD